VKWLEVSVTTSAEAAEAVADVLAVHATNGTVISGDTQTPNAPLTVRAYLPESGSIDLLQRSIREAIWHLSQISPIPEPSFTWIDGEDWAESWKKHFQPVAAGRTLIIVPAWMRAEWSPPKDSSRRPLFLEPGMAFGTGAHPSTRLCLAALEDTVRPGDLVIDVGCGSGILSVAAAFLGAGHVLACDLDELALRATRRSAELNGVEARLDVLAGSLPEVEARLGDGRRADVLVANILAPVLAGMLREGLAGLVHPGGRAILAGILSEQRDLVLLAGVAAGMSLEAETSEGDWLAMLYQRGSDPD